MEKLVLTLEGKKHKVEEPAFGKVKKVTRLYNEALQAIFTSTEKSALPFDALEPATEIFSILLGKEKEEIEDMKIGALEALDALHQAAEICGLKRQEKAQGEA